MKQGRRYILLIILLLLFNMAKLSAQEKFNQLENYLDKLSQTIPALNEEIDINVNNVSLQEFLRGMAKNVDLNISISPELDFNITNNFSGVKVKDVLLFFAKTYNLEVKSIGNILSVSKTEIKQKIEKLKEILKIRVVYEADSNFLSLDFVNQSLYEVTKSITNKSGKNIILSPNLGDKQVSSYIKKMPFDNTMDKFAFANGFVFEITEDGFYVLKNMENGLTGNKTNAGKSNLAYRSNLGKEEGENFIYTIRNRKNISVNSLDAPVGKVFRVISDSLRINYVLTAQLDGVSNLNLENRSFDEFLYFLFQGTDYLYSIENDIYIIANKNHMKFASSEIVTLENRTVEKITDLFPKELTNEIEIIEFSELNSLVLNGPSLKVQKLKNLIATIDKVVPLVLIEIIIVDVSKSHSVTTGLGMGVDKSKAGTGVKQISPGVDYSFSPATINNLFSKLNGFGWMNLGKVNSSFYMNLKALEDNGALKIKSTPKLSTLSGHEAVLSSGETQYYKEEKSNFIGTQNPTLSSSFIWKQASADLIITIKPIVSGDEQVTLEIEVAQSEFVEDTESSEAPPGTINRTFKSLIRMKDQEMVLLGGLDKVTTQNSGTGIPLVSRIPVIKWLFSSQTKSKSDAKLNVFIKPTIRY